MSYSAKNIEVLKGLEPVRLRPGMYIGNTGRSGLNHLIQELIDNSVDEHLAGHCDLIRVALEADGSCTVSDNGRGIPVDINHKAGKPAVEVVFTILHAGGKFGGGGYKVSGGLHGVGASVVNALSEWLEVTISRNLPQNNKEIADIVAELADIVPDSYLYELLWFIDDPQKALEEMKAQKEESQQTSLTSSLAAIGYGADNLGDTGGDPDNPDDQQNSATGSTITQPPE